MAFVINIKRPENIRDEEFRDNLGGTINAADYTKPDAYAFMSKELAEDIATEINRVYPDADAEVVEDKSKGPSWEELLAGTATSLL